MSTIELEAFLFHGISMLVLVLQGFFCRSFPNQGRDPTILTRDSSRGCSPLCAHLPRPRRAESFPPTRGESLACDKQLSPLDHPGKVLEVFAAGKGQWPAGSGADLSCISLE